MNHYEFFNDTNHGGNMMAKHLRELKKKYTNRSHLTDHKITASSQKNKCIAGSSLLETPSRYAEEPSVLT